MDITLILDASLALSKELAKIYTVEKNNLLLVSYSIDELKALKEELLILNPNLLIDIYQCNIENKEELNKLFVYLVINEYKINRLIFNMDYSIDKNMINLSNEEIDVMMNINNNAFISLIKHSLIDMNEARLGEILYISSIDNDTPLKAANTSFNNQLIKSLTKEYEDKNIKFLIYYLNKSKTLNNDQAKYAVRAVNALNKNKKEAYYSFLTKIKNNKKRC